MLSTHDFSGSAYERVETLVAKFEKELERDRTPVFTIEKMPRVSSSKNL